MEKISFTKHYNYKLNSAGNEWRRKSPDTHTHTHTHQERDKGYGTKKGTKKVEWTWAVTFTSILLYFTLNIT